MHNVATRIYHGRGVTEVIENEGKVVEMRGLDVEDICAVLATMVGIYALTSRIVLVRVPSSTPKSTNREEESTTFFVVHGRS
ncbi:hypothetical protein M378DRAFT_171645 [Amanita muscaria Koide BX008]|uniref:Uncharacterized protein n=1 Tax=Amanita muscaria (strain Koide BX008) TaxID=946122 RepID=A0A0C2W8S3_AMAMK|nr:hypothetical protein M378DRAFT_171645 [Amanita muscaria Koide BX008]